MTSTWPRRSTRSADAGASPVDGATPPGGAAHRTKIPSARRAPRTSARSGIRRSRRRVPGPDDGPPPRLAVPRSRAAHGLADWPQTPGGWRRPGDRPITRLAGSGARLAGLRSSYRAPSAARVSSYTRCADVTTGSYKIEVRTGCLEELAIRSCGELAGQRLGLQAGPGPAGRPARAGVSLLATGGAARRRRLAADAARDPARPAPAPVRVPAPPRTPEGKPPPVPRVRVGTGAGEHPLLELRPP